ncbi:cyclin-dependent kinase inhibitor 2c [Anaeramoeba ignava]|uniref:Cyclin-dependent kinase inhibitor 2c n=1 Tax=Anaeramoeba ignava TaxID=1746090 RepID=A0A9Q0LHU3_ANAIG|nr:cyclin-dependent kinase inhibitor 2c [Anaeramoeba ignava]
MKRNKNQTLLHLACLNQKKNPYATIKSLVEKRININAKNYYRQTPLHLACQFQRDSDSIDIISLLIMKGADVNIKNSKHQSPLHLVCIYQQHQNAFEIGKILVENGADVNAKNNYNETPLHVACQFQRHYLIEYVNYLIEKGTDVNARNKKNQTPLHLVCHNHKNTDAMRVIKLLVEKGADINAKNNYDEIPLHYACQIRNKNTFEVVKFLIESGSDFNAKNIESQTPLHFICQYQEENSFPIIKYLIEKGTLINAKNTLNQTALHFVCQFLFQYQSKYQRHGKNKDLFEAVKYFIDNGADINAKNKFQETPFHYAIRNYDPNQCKFYMLNDANLLDLEDYEITQEMIDFFPKIYSFNHDLNKFLKLNDNFSDFEIEANDSFKFKLHKQILLLRFDYNDSVLQNFVDICKKTHKESVQLAINFLYTGFPDFDVYSQRFESLINYRNKFIKLDEDIHSAKDKFLQDKLDEKKDLINILKKEKEEQNKNERNRKKSMKQVFKEIGLNSAWIKSKSKRKGLLNDFNKLYQEDESRKDFTIICQEKDVENNVEKKIKVHKLILIIRSELFKGMFLNVEDKTNQVHDYTKKSFDTLNQLIHFFYCDQFEESKMNQKIIQEFEDVKDYYQLNQNSIIDLFLFDLIQKFKQDDPKKEMKSNEIK